MLHRLRKEAPGKVFYEAPNATCPNMREISLEDVRDSLVKTQHKIELPAAIIKKARLPLERMIRAGR